MNKIIFSVGDSLKITAAGLASVDNFINKVSELGSFGKHLLARIEVHKMFGQTLDWNDAFEGAGLSYTYAMIDGKPVQACLFLYADMSYGLFMNISGKAVSMTIQDGDVLYLTKSDAESDVKKEANDPEIAAFWILFGLVGGFIDNDKMCRLAELKEEKESIQQCMKDMQKRLAEIDSEIAGMGE